MKYECYSYDVHLDTLEILSTILKPLYSIISDNGQQQQQQPKENERSNKFLSSLSW